MSDRPNNYQVFDGYRYRLDKWWWSDDYSLMICEYIPDDDIPYIDQVKRVNIPAN